MIRSLRIAHTSDVHLHDGSDGAPEHEAFSRVVEAVRTTGSDLFLIAGDLFDHNRVEGNVIDFVVEQLARVTCPTVIIAGNHDCWSERSVLQRTDFAQAGTHITLLNQPDGTQVEFPELHATVWGRCMLDHVPSNRPMAGAPARTGDFWHIGMAHGLYAEDPDTPRSSLITPKEIEASGFDYLALGHVHAHRQMRHGSTLACYPGIPIADGDKNGCLAIVDLAPGAPARVTAHPLSGAGNLRIR
jgi:DNA repair protein SbcD/Mre11